MHELSLDNINKIIADIRKQEINFSHLADDLTDHLCCDVEAEMEKGLGFSEAYKRVKQKIGTRRLKEIQEETLYAVDTKYRRMKNTMKISGITGTILFGFAALFKIQHWPGAGIMLTLGALILALVFMPSALRVLWKETHNRNRLFLFISGFIAGIFFILGIVFKIQHWSGAGILLTLTVAGVILFTISLLKTKLSDPDNKNKRLIYISGAIAIIFYTAGVFFKIQHWPGATLLMVAGMIILFAFVFPVYSYITWKEELHITSKFLYMVIGSLTLIIPGTLINLKLQQSYEANYFIHNEQQQALFSYLSGYNNSLITNNRDSLIRSVTEELHTRTVGLLALIGNIQSDMVRKAEGEPGKPAIADEQIKMSETGPGIQYRQLSYPFHPAPVKDFLYTGSASPEDLDPALDDYLNYLSAVINSGEIQKNIRFLNTPLNFPESGIISMLSGLHYLELLKNRILTAESAALKVIIGNQ